VTLTTAISAPAQIVNGDASMGQQLVQKWCNDCRAVGAGMPKLKAPCPALF
jgi:cytochrome c2